MSEATQPTALLISLRDPSDAMAAHERLCFAEAAGLPSDNVGMHCMVTGRPTDADLRRYDAIFFGGSGAFSVLDDVDWIRSSVDVLLQVVELRIPSWASCFGFQGLSVALGGEVINDDDKAEMGSTLVRLTDVGRADPIFSELPDAFWVQEGHHDRVSQLPKGVTLTVRGDFVHEQAFRVDGAPFWASQFHPELTIAKTIDRFHHYQKYYLKDDEAPAVLASLKQGAETPGVSALLSRLVRKQY